MGSAESIPMRTLYLRVLFELLQTLDVVFPGWSQRREDPAEHGALSADSLTYWLTAERCRRTRD